MAESAIYFWNEVALELARRDYEPFVGSSGAPMIMPEQAGPTRTSRALAMIHVAMYEALALSDPASGLTPFGLAVGAAPAGPVGAAVTGAAVSTMQALFKNAAQKAYVEDRAAFYTQMLRAGGATQASIDAGKAFGAKVGAAMIKDREGDTPIVGQPDDRNYKVERCHHQADPYAFDQGRLNPRWGELVSFCRPTTKPEAAGYDHTTILGAPPLCDLSDSNGRYSKEYTEVRDKGDARSTHRTLDETIIGLFWAYDGAWRIGTPPRLYNQCVRAVVEAHDEKSEKKFGEAALARLFALINVGMADAGIVAWQAKYAHDLWRPVIGIRQEDEGFGPGKQEGKAVVNGDPFWRPLGAPQTNQRGALSRTPNFPAYPSGHAAFGTTCFEIVRQFLVDEGGDPNLSFAVESEELNGRNVDPDGSVRTAHRRTLNLTKAIAENIESRVWLGVHWRFDGEGLPLAQGGLPLGGRAIGEYLAPKIRECFPPPPPAEEPKQEEKTA